MRVLRDEEQALDAIQEAFLKVYTRLRRFEGRSSFYTWFYRLVMNQCLDMKRRERADRKMDLPESDTLERLLESGGSRDEVPGGREHEESPEERFERRELRRVVARAIDQLPDGARETLVLREVEGLSYAEIAEVLGIPKGTVMSRLHYARRRVQAVLERAGVLEGERGHAGGDPPAEPSGVRG
jgi:RNA polymerase sigma-70 factor (ECF subfamily)